MSRKIIWTKEKCYEEALKYKTKKDFKKYSGGAYDAVIKKYNCLNDACGHMIRVVNKNRYRKWTKEKCYEEALKYKTKKDFKKYSCGAYNAAYNIYNCLDDVCSHMITQGNLYKRCIYVYEFSDNFVYVGLTYNLDARKIKHLKSGQVYKHIQINNNYIVKKLTGYIDITDAQKMEAEYVKVYKNKGWNILNVAKTGGLGNMGTEYTFKMCQNEAIKYNRRSKFHDKSYTAYKTARKNGWLDDICSHMPAKNIWDYNNCKKEAQKYKNKNKFQLNNKPAYESARKNKWLDDICSHMICPINDRNFWDYNNCKKEAQKYKTRTEFNNNNNYVYKLVLKNKWINDFFINS